MKMSICPHCNKNIENLSNSNRANHVKWCELNPKSPKNNKIKCVFCNEYFNPINVDYHTETCPHNPKNQRNCYTCGELLLDNRNKFCDHSCAAKYNNSRKSPKQSYTKQKKEEKVCENCSNTFLVAEGSSNYIPLCDKCKMDITINHNRKKLSHCVICKKPIYLLKSKNRKTCSYNCHIKHLANMASLNPNCGGETNYKKYLYKDIWMDSSWEVKVAKYLDEKNIKWVRNRKLLFYWFDKMNRKRRYYPDFFLPEYNIYLDTKNKYLMKKDKYKIENVIKNNNISLIVGDVKYVIYYIDYYIEKFNDQFICLV